MKNLFILLSLVLCVSLSQAQLQTVKIDTYNGSTHSYANVATYTNSQTDTTAWVEFADVDSVQFYISTSDSARVFIYPIYGDNVYSKQITSAATDSLVTSGTTATGWKSISWASIVAGCGSQIIGAKFKIAFQSVGNAASSESAYYRVYIKKFKK